MRKFRNASIAAATAVALTLSGTAVASAQDDDPQVGRTSVSMFGSSQTGKEQDAWHEGPDGTPVVGTDQQVVGTDLLGSITADDNPKWAESWKSITTVGVVGAIAGAIIGGINWLKFQGILPY
ncbi:hypothetical protein [Corynebacterium sp.]|uniref:hypothetical protein n=1 Tax=Corynebacterium sp. TaxID=1720 RepID=UPI0026DEE164|nr:hypothetical protein [Corynebacterium sp.]MDO5513004.1 hypothetical protein [Corynebacterium sp.]